MYKFLVLIIVIFFSCNSEKKYIEYTEKESGDSIIYFKDFDLNSFKGINQLKYDSLNYPFVELVYDKGKLILKAHHNKKKTHQLIFFKLQNKWCNHSSHYYDGLQNHQFLISLDTALLRLEYSRNPLDKKSEYPANLNLVSLKQYNNDTIFETIYQHFYDGNFSKLPSLDKFDLDFYRKKSNEVLYSKEFVQNDSITSMYISYSKYDIQNNSKNYWSISRMKLLSNSIFFSDFDRYDD